MKIGNITADNFILGAGRMGDSTRKKECFNILDRYSEMCYNTLDVARSYKDGACEEFLGEYLKTRDRNKFVIISKGGFPLDRKEMFKTRVDEKNMRLDLENSLKALNTDYIDVYFLHRDDVSVHPGEFVEFMNKFVQEGKVREIAVSNWTAGRIQIANDYAKEHGLKPFSASQINYSLALTTPALTGDLTHIVMNDVEYGWYKETSFPIIAYSVQAKGFFSKVYSGEKLKPSGELSYPPLKENYRRAERLKILSEQKNATIPQLLLSYVLSKDINSAVIGGFSTVEQLVESEKGVHITLNENEIQFLEKGLV